MKGKNEIEINTGKQIDRYLADIRQREISIAIHNVNKQIDRQIDRQVDRIEKQIDKLK